MPFTNDDYLPSYEELTVPELTMTAAPLRAGAVYFGKYCDEECKEFMLCSKEEKDARRCLREGKAVTRCGVEFYNKVRNSCADSFTSYWQCLDNSSYNMDYYFCKKTQAAFDNCMKEELGMNRPYLGYFSRVRVHNTARPKPQHIVPMPEPIPDAPVVENHPLLEQAKEKAKYGNTPLI